MKLLGTLKNGDGAGWVSVKMLAPAHIVKTLVAFDRISKEMENAKHAMEMELIGQRGCKDELNKRLSAIIRHVENIEPSELPKI